MADSRPLPRNPSLESLKKQAKALLRAWRAGETEARERVRAAHPKPERFSSLRDAQLVVAREYGLPGWEDLRVSVEAANLAAGPRAERVAAFLRDACLDYREDRAVRRRRARRLLDDDPTLARESVHTAAAAADADALRDFVAADPACVTRRGGPQSWEPLLFVTYSRLPGAGDAVEAARILLDAGADPNVGARLYDAYRFTALTGAMGEGEAGLESQPPHPQARALAELLLERGADPNDAQGLYNTHFTPGNEWLELLLAHGLTAEDRVDWADDAGTRTLDYQLAQAITRGLGDRVELLLAHGADPNARDFYDGRPLFEHALLHGRTEIADLLLANGAERVELSPAARFRAACMAGDAEAARAELADDPSLVEDERLIHDAVLFGSDAAVRLILDLGGPVEAKGRHFGETPLQQAALQGRDAIVEALLARGARLDVRDPSFGGTAVGWATHGGHEALREKLLDRTDDVFDLAAWGRVDRLRARLADDPAQARRTLTDGETALHGLRVAGERGAAVVDVLLANGADLEARTADGATPLAAALAREDEEVAELLRERGAAPEGGEAG